MLHAWEERTFIERQRLASAQHVLGTRQSRLRQRMCLVAWRQQANNVTVLLQVCADC